MNRGCCSASAQATTVNSQQIWFCSCPCQEQVAHPGVLDGPDPALALGRRRWRSSGSASRLRCALV